MSTVIHSPGETDAALDLFTGDTDTSFYQKHGYYGYPHFMELAQRTGIMKTRAERIIAQLSLSEDESKE